MMRPFGKIYPMTITEEELVIPFMPFLLTEVSFVGACTSTPESVEQMLRFAAKHGVKPVLEKFPFTLDGISSALKKLEDGGMRYRGVLVV